MRHERIFSLVRECQLFANASAQSCRRDHLETTARTFAARVPKPENHVEKLCMMQILEDLTVGLAEHVHASFHREFGGNSRTCGFEAGKIARGQWSDVRPFAPGEAFTQSVGKYFDVFELVHPIPAAVKAAELLELRFVEGVRISTLARAVGCHPVRLRKLFRERHGVTIRSYLTNYRLRQAAERLRDSRVPVDDIVGDVGFGSRDHFYRAFTRAFGVTPAEYRRQNHERSAETVSTPERQRWCPSQPATITRGSRRIAAKIA